MSACAKSDGYQHQRATSVRLRLAEGPIASSVPSLRRVCPHCFECALAAGGHGVSAQWSNSGRSQYTLGFTPSTPQDGKYHKLKIDAVDEQGNLLLYADKKGKKKKTIVHARGGYTAILAPAGN